MGKYISRAAMKRVMKEASDGALISKEAADFLAEHLEITVAAITFVAREKVEEDKRKKLTREDLEAAIASLEA